MPPFVTLLGRATDALGGARRGGKSKHKRLSKQYLLRKTTVGCVLARTSLVLPRNKVRASTHP
ncbi:MAG: hypothetical protein JW959_03490, partial [Pirellulales bacterium]|nr:hypothetical protein [Pirellulales bacterium]